MKHSWLLRLTLLWCLAAAARPLEIPAFWQKWINEDLCYIISDNEKAAFKRLHNDEERREFAIQFWLRRDPTPDTPENEYKEEHYRRIAYADHHYASDVPGWKTDRGMVYIRLGAPDEIDASDAGSPEVWHYRYIQELGTNVEMHFVGAGHRLSQDDLAKVRGITPPKGYVLCESMSQFDQVCVPSTNRVDIIKTPVVNFKDLDATVNSRVNYTTLPTSVRTDFLRITDSTVSAKVMIQFRNSDLKYATTGRNSKATVHIYGRIQTLSGKTVEWFEDTVTSEIPADRLQPSMGGRKICSRDLLLAPGTYRLNIVAKDTVGNTFNTFEDALNIPHYEEGQLAASSLVLGDQLQPCVNNVFQQDETMGIYTEFYNLGMDGKTGKPSGIIKYEVLNSDNNTVMSQTEDLTTIPNASSFLVTVKKKLPLKTLPPGRYTLKLKIDDRIKNRTISPVAEFSVTT